MISKRIFLVAGEQSGDNLGGELAKDLKKAGFILEGVGGKQMASAGVELFLSLEKFQVMGFSAVLKAAPQLFSNYLKVKKRILERSPEVVILIDYQDFNLLLAKGLRRAGYAGKIVQYVSPSVWAWRKKRVKTLSKKVDLLLTIFPFEKPCYEKTSLRVAYVGHPLPDVISSYHYQELDLEREKKLIALFPGSRWHEIEQNLPIQLQAARHLEGNIAISCARSEWKSRIEKELKKYGMKGSIIDSEKSYDLMKRADGAIAKSGTVVLELALHGIPTVVTYPLSFLNYILGRYLFRIILPYYSLPNMILGQKIFPEFIDRKLDPEDIAEALKKLMKKGVRNECSKITDSLKRREETLSAAEEVMQML